MIVVDSSVWIANLKNLNVLPVHKLRNIQFTQTILVGDLILLEVLQGARDELHAARLEQDLRQFQIANMLDDHISVQAARNYRLLRQNGVTLRKMADLIIGTFCIEEGHSLLHNDRDFDPMATILGLVVE
jgi:predicted nucleic acid-binding protein